MSVIGGWWNKQKMSEIKIETFETLGEGGLNLLKMSELNSLSNPILKQKKRKTLNFPIFNVNKTWSLV